MRYRLKSLVPALISCGLLSIFSAAVHAGKVYISKGTEITIKYKLTLSTDLGSKPADSDIFEVASDQKFSGIDVIRQGDSVYCKIIKFKKPGLLGGGGAIEVRIDSVQTALGKNIKVKSTTLKAIGKSKRLKAILMLPILGYGILVKGDPAEVGRQNDTVTLKTSELEQITF